MCENWGERKKCEKGEGKGGNVMLASVASVSVGVFAAVRGIAIFRFLAVIGASATNGRRGEGEGRQEKETLARIKNHGFAKRPFDTFTVG